MNVTKVTLIPLKDRMTLTYCSFLLILFILIDLVADYDRSLTIWELLSDTFLELGILGLTLYMSRYIWSRFVVESESRIQAQAGLEQALSEVRRFEDKERENKIRFNSMCEELFSEWMMTKSEREVAHLLMGPKGLKEIAAHRFTSEGTIKNQARAIYQKAKVKNRTEFLSLFIMRIGQGAQASS